MKTLKLFGELLVQEQGPVAKRMWAHVTGDHDLAPDTIWTTLERGADGLVWASLAQFFYDLADREERHHQGLALGALVREGLDRWGTIAPDQGHCHFCRAVVPAHDEDDAGIERLVCLGWSFSYFVPVPGLIRAHERWCEVACMICPCCRARFLDADEKLKGPQK